MFKKTIFVNFMLFFVDHANDKHKFKFVKIIFETSRTNMFRRTINDLFNISISMIFVLIDVYLHRENL